MTPLKPNYTIGRSNPDHPMRNRMTPLKPNYTLKKQ